MPDPIRKRFGHRQLGPLRPACSQNRAGSYNYAESDFPHPFQLRFCKEGMDHIVPDRPGSDLDGLVRVWPNTSRLEASRCAGIIWPGFWQDATGLLPVSHFQTRFRSPTDVPDNTVQNRPGSDLGGLVRVWPNTSGLEASRCAGIIWPGFWQDANGPLPVSHFQTRFHRRPGQYRAKPARIRFSSG